MKKNISYGKNVYNDEEIKAVIEGTTTKPTGIFA